jgi:hypothetical protein
LESRVRIALLTRLMNVAVASCVVLLISSVVAIGLEPSEPTAQELRERAFNLRLLLFSSALLLASGVVEIFLLFDWPRHVVRLQADPRVVIAPSITIAAGVVFSFLLLLVYRQ